MCSMTNEQINQSQSSNVEQNDWLLQSLVNMANNDGIEIGITLQVSGILVSGDLVSIETYFDEIGEEFLSGFVNRLEVEELIKDSFSKFGERFTKIQTDKTEIDQPLPQFLHLKNARFFHTSGNPVPTNRGVFWRGRISEVGGFCLGNLSIGDPIQII